MNITLAAIKRVQQLVEVTRGWIDVYCNWGVLSVSLFVRVFDELIGCSERAGIARVIKYLFPI